MHLQGLAENTPQGIRLISDEIAESLNIEMCVLMGANLGNDNCYSP